MKLAAVESLRSRLAQGQPRAAGQSPEYRSVFGLAQVQLRPCGPKARLKRGVCFPTPTERSSGGWGLRVSGLEMAQKRLWPVASVGSGRARPEGRRRRPLQQRRALPGARLAPESRSRYRVTLPELSASCEFLIGFRQASSNSRIVSLSMSPSLWRPLTIA